VLAGDNELKHHLQNSSQTAIYISKTTQNELLQALEYISKWVDVTSSSKSHCFIRCLTSTEFIVSVKIINLIFTITYSLRVKHSKNKV
jgi:hypothetical protein